MRLTVLLLMATLLSFTQKANAQAHNDIVWAINESPPFHILRGEYAGQGICDAMVGAFKEQLPDVMHRSRWLPSRRITSLMRRERNLCFPCFIKRTSYNADFLYTDTTHLYPPHGIIAHASAAEHIKQQYGNPVRFNELVKDNSLRFAQPIERRYGDLQPLLEEHLIGTPQYRIVTGDNAHMNLMTMLASERVDYTIDYEMIKNFYETTEKNDALQSLVFLPISEYQGKVIEGAVGCSNNAWGERAISRLNSAIKAVKKDDTFNEALDRWIGSDRPKEN